MSGPFDAPDGSRPETYLVTIQAVVPWVNTDPVDWDFAALLDWIGLYDSSEVTSVKMGPVPAKVKDHTGDKK